MTPTDAHRRVYDLLVNKHPTTQQALFEAQKALDTRYTR